MQVEIQHRLQRRDRRRFRLSHCELDGEAQGRGDLHRFEDFREHGDGDPDRMFVEQFGVPVQQGEVGIRVEHDEIYRHAIAPGGQGVDINVQRK